MYSTVSGNVGIGTTTPGAALDVNGDVNTSSFYRINGDTVLSTTGSANIFVGKNAGINNTGNGGTFVGDVAGPDNQGNYNTFIGNVAGWENTTGAYNVFVGEAAGLFNTQGSHNTFVGGETGMLNESGYYNTIVGFNAGRFNVSGHNNVFLGNGAGYHETGSNKLYIANDIDTSDVLIYGDFATRRLGVGMVTPTSTLDVNGDINTNSHYLINGDTVLVTTYNFDTFVGISAGGNNTGNAGTFVGYHAGLNNQGDNNVFLGEAAGRVNTTGQYNLFAGAGSGLDNTAGSYNTFLGGESALLHETGNSNTFVGYNSGRFNTSGSGNVFLGYLAEYNETGSDKLYIANSSLITDVLIYGEFDTRRVGIGTATAVNTLSVGGGASIGGGYAPYTAPTDGLIVQNNVGIGTTIPSHKLTVNSSTDDALRLIGPDGGFGYGARLNFGDADYVYLDEDLDDKLTINASRTAITGGNVGIGTVTPANALSVGGSTSIGSGYTSSTAPTNSIIVEGKMGIGTTNPTQILHLYSTFNPRLLIEAPSTQVPEINLRRGTTTHAMYVNGGNDLVFYRAGDRVTFTDDGNVGIGATIPQERLHVNGRVYVQTMDGTASGSAVRWYNNRLYYQSSSKKYKDDIQPLRDDFEKILDAESVSFTDKLSGERHIGFIAEEFADLGLDNLVIERDGEPDAIRYEMVSVYLLEMIKELRTTTGQLAQENQVL